jgi:hypothetical protein
VVYKALSGVGSPLKRYPLAATAQRIRSCPRSDSPEDEPMSDPIAHLNTACYQITCDPRFPEIGHCPHCRSRVETHELDRETTRESLLERAPSFSEPLR